MHAIRHEPADCRFVLQVEGDTAFISYRELSGHTLDLNHTFVPVPVRGSGIASQLTAHALRYARDRGYKVLPSCPFVAAYIARNPEYQNLSA